MDGALAAAARGSRLGVRHRHRQLGDRHAARRDAAERLCHLWHGLGCEPRCRHTDEHGAAHGCEQDYDGASKLLSYFKMQAKWRGLQRTEVSRGSSV